MEKPLSHNCTSDPAGRAGSSRRGVAGHFAPGADDEPGATAAPWHSTMVRVTRSRSSRRMVTGFRFRAGSGPAPSGAGVGQAHQGIEVDHGAAEPAHAAEAESGIPADVQPRATAEGADAVDEALLVGPDEFLVDLRPDQGGRRASPMPTRSAPASIWTLAKRSPISTQKAKRSRTKAGSSKKSSIRLFNPRRSAASAPRALDPAFHDQFAPHAFLQERHAADAVGHPPPAEGIGNRQARQVGPFGERGVSSMIAAGWCSK